MMTVLSILTNFLLFIATLIVAIILFYKRSFTYWKRKGVPTFDPKIPFGDLQNHMTREISRMEELVLLYNKAKAKGYKKYCGIYQLTAPTLFVLDLELIKNICVKDFEHFVDRGFYYNEKDDPISCHLLSIDGDRWKYARKKASTIFTSSRLKWMFQNIKESVDSLVEFMDKVIENGDQPVNIRNIVSYYTADSVGSSTLGIKCRSFTDPEKAFVKYGHKVLELSRVGQFLLLFGLSFPNLSRKLGIRQTTPEVSNFFYRVISETVEKRRKNNIDRSDFLQLLMNLQEASDDERPFTLDEVVALSFGLFIGGFETSSNTLSFALYYLARHQQYQDKAREEVQTVLKKFNNEITYEASQELKYVQQCIDETLRLHPPVHTLNRVCTKTYKVPGEDLVIEKNSKILITLTGIQQDPEYYERPKEFYPDHFTDENRKKRHPLAHIPFGVGPRECIGKRYGKLKLQTALAALLSNFRITVDKKTEEPIKLSPSAFVPVAIGLFLNFERLPNK